MVQMADSDRPDYELLTHIYKNANSIKHNALKSSLSDMQRIDEQIWLNLLKQA